MQRHHHPKIHRIQLLVELSCHSSPALCVKLHARKITSHCALLILNVLLSWAQWADAPMLHILFLAHWLEHNCIRSALGHQIKRSSFIITKTHALSAKCMSKIRDKYKACHAKSVTWFFYFNPFTGQLKVFTFCLGGPHSLLLPRKSAADWIFLGII